MSDGSEEATLDPDELCLVCNTTRENHGDRQHRFNPTDDQLVRLEPRPAPRATPPQERGMGPSQPGQTPEARALATLVEVLAEKEILSGKDIIRIFTGNH